MPAKTAIRRAVCLMVLAATGGLMAGCSSTTGGTAAQGAVTTESAAPTPTPQWPAGNAPGTLANPYHIGQEMVDGDWSMTINSVNFDANQEFAALDGLSAYMTPKPGQVWVSVQATWKYNGDKPDTNPGTDFDLVTPAWTNVDDTNDSYGITANNISTLAQGQVTAAPATKGFSKTGSAYLEVPTQYANDSSSLVVTYNWDSGDQAVVSLKQ